jgi:hypothetical protein
MEEHDKRSEAIVPPRQGPIAADNSPSVTIKTEGEGGVITGNMADHISGLEVSIP